MGGCSTCSIPVPVPPSSCLGLCMLPLPPVLPHCHLLATALPVSRAVVTISAARRFAFACRLCLARRFLGLPAGMRCCLLACAITLCCTLLACMLLRTMPYCITVRAFALRLFAAAWQQPFAYASVACLPVDPRTRSACTLPFLLSPAFFAPLPYTRRHCLLCLCSYSPPLLPWLYNCIVSGRVMQ